MGKPSEVWCTRQISDSSKTSRIILCDVLVDMVFGYINLNSRESRH